MASANPYQSLPPGAFWRTGVAESSPFQMRDLYAPKFAVSRATKIATAGSCFAQHLGRRLSDAGYGFMDVEPAPWWLPAGQRRDYGFATYSARIGNIYTVVQLLQLAQEAAGTFEPQTICWRKNGRFFDALRPAVEPDGHESEATLRLHRRFHIEKVRALFAEMDVLIFTLGLTEAWRHKASGTVYPNAPGVIAGTFDSDEHEFVNFNVGDMERAFHTLLSTLGAIRPDGRAPKVLLTVSPVPLTATADGRHVLQASTYSKAALRAFAGQAAAHECVDYFPAYEIVTHPAARGVFFENNLRTVRAAGVDAVMGTFFAAHDQGLLDGARPQEVVRSPTAGDARDPLNADVQCEDSILEAFG